MDSPLAVNLTHVFKSHPECYDFETLEFLEQHGDPFGFERLRYTQSVGESIALNDEPGPMIIILLLLGCVKLDGLCITCETTWSRLKNTIVIVGFMAQHTLGRRLVEKRDQVKIFGVMRDRRARVEVLDGFSAHAGKKALIKYAKTAGPGTKKVFLVHGEIQAQKNLSEELEKRGLDTHIPSQGEVVTLD